MADFDAVIIGGGFAGVCMLHRVRGLGLTARVFGNLAFTVGGVPPLIKIGREDVNWAHELLKEIDKRIRFDVSSLNADTSDGVIGQLTSRYGVSGGQAGRMWQPLDSEKPLAEYVPPAEAPDAAAVRAAIAPPETPEEFPAAALLLERLVQPALDPWAIDLPPQD